MKKRCRARVLASQAPTNFTNITDVTHSNKKQGRNKIDEESSEDDSFVKPSASNVRKHANFDKEKPRKYINNVSDESEDDSFVKPATTNVRKHGNFDKQKPRKYINNVSDESEE